ncbi:LOW QUALITY PROTEIN: nucleoporin NDC1 [Procambarus clarkii]|uniref:LOW QUALITY PROTEIN: nucleoporin NDC1 n=1 Tax=Procambarus clarkii TaxID=6728 RepID=UPI001E6708AD|nr:nucleoporin NDC1-like [Procambarus clarkii]
MKPEELFSKEVLLWRYVRALACLLLLQVVAPMAVCNLYHTVVAQGVWNPVTIVSNLVTSCIYPTKLMRLVVPAVCFVLLARVHIKSYAVSAWVPLNRWEKWRRILSLTVLFRSGLIMIACALLANFYTSLAHPDFPFFLRACMPGDIMCLKRKTLIMFMGVYMGYHYSYKYFMANGNVVTPAPAHPRKLQLIKASLSLQNLRDACNTYGASKLSFLFAICFYMAVAIAISLMYGGTWQEWLVIFDLSLMMMTMLATVLLAISLALFSQVFHIFITEPVEIPVATEEDSNPEADGCSWRLCHALSSSGLLQLLAFYDLKSLAASDPRNFARRSQVFTISQPGGHPRNWLGIVNPSLNLIRKFCERLRKHNCPESLPKVSPVPAGTGFAPTDVNKNEVAKLPQVPLKERLINVIMGLKRFPIFGYFLSDLPDSTNRSIFAEGLPVIWAIQALGDLTAASFTEDKYGVVQRNIPDILMAFTQLQKVVDGLGRVTLARRAGTGESLPAELQLRKALRFSLRSALYTITTTFGHTVLEMQVSCECQNKLLSYLEFKEG